MSTTGEVEVNVKVPESVAASTDDIKKEVSVVEQQPAGENRGQFNNHIEFFLSSLGLAVGLGNIWRFPAVCYENGGATFLIPYLLMLLLIGLPMFFLEMSLGQYAGLSATKIYSRISPGLRGMGYGMVTIPTIINFQYVVIMAYGLFFLFSGFDIQWDTCNHDYNTLQCYSVKMDKELKCTESNLVYWNHTCTEPKEFCEYYGLTYDVTSPNECQVDPLNPLPFNDGAVAYNFTKVPNGNRVSSSEEYWYYRVLHMKGIVYEYNNKSDENQWDNRIHVDTNVNSWSKWGNLRWDITGCLFASWAFICLSLIKGMASYGKVVYFTTLFPYVVLTTFLCYVATFDGFIDGLDYYIVPKDWSKLYDVNNLNAAASQIFYSLGVAVGSQLVLSSYNDFRTNTFRDASLIAVCNSLTSIYAGTVVFGALGFIAKQKDVDIAEVVQSGPGLVFIVFPEVITLMEVPELFSFLFFLMINLLAISSVCGSWEAFIAAINDEFPVLRQKRVIVMVVSCFLAFMCGFAMCFESGFFLFDIMNDRCGNAILLMALIELTTISWFYGSKKMMRHITDDMEIPVPKFMQVYFYACWTFITPLIIAAVTLLTWIGAEPDQYLDYVFPDWVQAIGFGLEFVGVAVLVLVAIAVAIKRARAGKPWALIKPGPMMTPNKLWGPRPDSGLPMPSESIVAGTSYKNFGYFDELK